MRSASTDAVLSGQPTNVRYVVVFVTFIAAVMLYLHRFCFTYVQRFVKEDLQLTDRELSYCFSAFFLAYALAQVPSGWMSDRFGVRRMLTVYIVVWSLFTALMGWTAGFIMLIALRAAVGIGQAGAYPTSAALISKWIPFAGRARASSLVALGGRCGGVLAPFLTAPLIVFIVSFESSSQLQSGDILDAYYLSFQFSNHEQTQLFVGTTTEESAEPASRPAGRIGRRIYAALSESDQQFVDALAQTYARALQQHVRDHPEVQADIDAGEYIPSLDLVPVPAPQEAVDAIVHNCNRALDRHDFYQADDFHGIRLESEAEKLIAQQESLTNPQRQRLNRLCLEAAFPNSVKKFYGHGWRPLMFVYGFVGFFAAGIFWLCARNRPRQHARCNAAELELIEAGRPETVPSEHGRVSAVPLKHMVASRSLWLMCVNQWGGNVGWVFLVTWLPRYLYEVHSVPFVERGMMAGIPLWFGWAGMLLGGWLSDRVVQRFGLRWRTLPIAGGRLLGMAAYLSCLLHPSAWTITALFAIVAFSSDISNPSSWSYKMDVGGRYVGSIHGWANMWGNLGATMSPILLQFVVEKSGWDAAFLTCAAAFLLAAVAALGVDARIPIVPEKEEERGLDQDARTN